MMVRKEETRADQPSRADRSDRMFLHSLDDAWNPDACDPASDERRLREERGGNPLARSAEDQRLRIGGKFWHQRVAAVCLRDLLLQTVELSPQLGASHHPRRIVREDNHRPLAVGEPPQLIQLTNDIREIDELVVSAVKRYADPAQQRCPRRSLLNARHVHKRVEQLIL